MTENDFVGFKTSYKWYHEVCFSVACFFISLTVSESSMVKHVTLVPGQSFVLLDSTPLYEYSTSLFIFPFEGLPFFAITNKKMLLITLCTLKTISDLMPSNGTARM